MSKRIFTEVDLEDYEPERRAKRISSKEKERASLTWRFSFLLLASLSSVLFLLSLFFSLLFSFVYLLSLKKLSKLYPLLLRSFLYLKITFMLTFAFILASLNPGKGMKIFFNYSKRV